MPGKIEYKFPLFSLFSVIIVLLVTIWFLFMASEFVTVHYKLAINYLLAFFFFILLALTLWQEMRKMELDGSVLSVTYYFLRKKVIDLGNAKEVALLRSGQGNALAQMVMQGTNAMVVIYLIDGTSFIFSVTDENGLRFAEEVKRKFNSLRNKGPDNP